MAGVGTLIKQAKKMQQKIGEVQKTLQSREIDVSSGGGAVQIKVNGAGKFLAIKLEPALLKKSPKVVEETLLAAVHEAAAKVKEANDSDIQRISAEL